MMLAVPVLVQLALGDVGSGMHRLPPPTPMLLEPMQVLSVQQQCDPAFAQSVNSTGLVSIVPFVTAGEMDDATAVDAAVNMSNACQAGVRSDHTATHPLRQTDRHAGTQQAHRRT